MMAFFEYLQAVYDAIGTLFKPIGGRTIASFDPDPWASIPNYPDPNVGGMASLDSAGHLHVRGPVMTDEGSSRDDFTGSSLYTNLTGTLTFGATTTVTGSGTAFLSEVNRDCYLRLSTDGADKFVKVVEVVSDTELELESAYAGTVGSGTGVVSYWIPKVTGAASWAVSSSNLTLSSNTASGNEARVIKQLDYLPLVITFRASVSQRIANQTICFGVMDDVDSPNELACVVFDGTTNTTAKFVTYASAAVADQQTTTFTLPTGSTSDKTAIYQICLSVFSCILLVNGEEVAKHQFHTPGLYTVMFARVRVYNTGIAASNTDAAIDGFTCSNQNQVQVVNSFRSDPITVRIEEEVHHLVGTLTTTATTADQVIASTTIPTGKIAYLLGYQVSCTSGANAAPIKIGRNPPMTIPASPGSVDPAILEAFDMITVTQSPPDREQSDFSANPRRIAGGGDVLAMTVTPSAATSTVWRATLYYVLR